jgi:hypothetical protein
MILGCFHELKEEIAGIKIQIAILKQEKKLSLDC